MDGDDGQDLLGDECPAVLVPLTRFIKQGKAIEASINGMGYRCGWFMSPDMARVSLRLESTEALTALILAMPDIDFELDTRSKTLTWLGTRSNITYE